MKTPTKSTHKRYRDILFVLKIEIVAFKILLTIAIITTIVSGILGKRNSFTDYFMLLIVILVIILCVIFQMSMRKLNQYNNERIINKVKKLIREGETDIAELYLIFS